MDLLGKDATMYSIESTPAEPILKRFANGDTMRQYVFSLCSRTLYEPAENMATAEFYEKFADWLEECTREGDPSGADRPADEQVYPGDNQRISV